MKFKGKDILLAFLYATGKTDNICEPILGTTRLTKAIFLFEEEIKSKFTTDDLEEMPEFMAWNFGPWSKQLVDDIDFFVGIGFMSMRMVNSSDVSLAESEEARKIDEEIDLFFEDSDEDAYSQKEYKLTEVGRKYVEQKIWSSMSPEQQKVLSEFKKKINGASLYSIIRYVYQNYSKKGNDWTKNSLIRDKHI